MHRLVVVDEEDKVIGIISLSDLLMYLVLRPTGECGGASLRNEHASIAEKDESPIPDATVDPSGDQSDADVDDAANLKDTFIEADAQSDTQDDTQDTKDNTESRDQ